MTNENIWDDSDNPIGSAILGESDFYPESETQDILDDIRNLLHSNPWGEPLYSYPSDSEDI